MKSFKEQLNIVKANNCNITDIIIAGSCESIFDFQYTDEEFERLCGIALNAYLHADQVSEDEIAWAINDWMNHNGNIDLLEEKSAWDILEASIDGWDDDDLDDAPWCEGWTSPEDCENCLMVECNCNPEHCNLKKGE